MKRARQDSNLWPSAPEAVNLPHNPLFYSDLRTLLTSRSACRTLPRCGRCPWSPDVFHETGRRPAHRLQHMAKGIAFRPPRVRVAEHVLDQSCVPHDAVQRRALAVAEIVGSDSVNPAPRYGPDERAADGGCREAANRPKASRSSSTSAVGVLKELSASCRPSPLTRRASEFPGPSVPGGSAGSAFR